MQMGHEAGQIKPGFYADLVILDGDPLADIRIFQDQDRILGVMKGGKFAKRDTALSTRAPHPYAQDGLNLIQRSLAWMGARCRR